MVWGVFRTRLLLPAEAVAWGDSQVRSVLLHELAHVKRRDLAGQWLMQLACALHWFNPLVWFAAWRLHVEGEQACDNLVLSSGVRASEYAGHLLQVAKKLHPACWTHAGGLAMARPSRLESRLLAVLNERSHRRGVTRALAMATAALGLCVIVPLAMLRARGQSADATGSPQEAASPKDRTPLRVLPANDDRRQEHAAAPRDSETVTVEIADNGSLSFLGKPVLLDALGKELAALQRTNKHLKATLRAPADAALANVVNVLDALIQAGVTSVSLSTRTGSLPEADRARLRQAKTEFDRASTLRRENLIAEAEYDKAKAEFEQLQAELRGDDAGAVRLLKLQQAEAELERVSKLQAARLVSERELEQARFNVELRQAELKDDPIEVSRVRLRQAEAELGRVNGLHQAKLVSEHELNQARFIVELRQVELKGDPTEVSRVRLRQAEAELGRLTELRQAKLISEHELNQARFTVELREAELKGDATEVSRVRLRQAEEELKRVSELRRQKLVGEDK